MIATKTFVLKTNSGKDILLDAHFKPNNTPKPIIVFCHGYKGFKDWGAWHIMANTFAQNNYFFVKFNFSHNGGTIDQPIDFPDLDAFGNNNYTQELKDLDTVLNWFFSKNKLDHQFTTNKISLMGHSRGGGIVSIKASEDARATSLITLAGVSDYKSRFPKEDALQAWQQDGVYYVQNGRTKQHMPHYFQFYKNFIENQDRLTISKAVKKISIPHLIIHGSADTSVTINEAYQQHQWNPKSKLKIIEAANHVFGAAHPWQNNTLPTHLNTVVTTILKFLK